MDIDQRFDQILLDHNVIDGVSYEKAIDTLKKLEIKLFSGKKIGLYGVGIEAEGLLRFISAHTEQFQISVCFDKTIRDYQYKDIIQDHNVYPIECCVDMEIDCLILGSYIYSQSFCDNLKILGYQGEVIDLFGDMEGYIHDHFTDYSIIFKTKQEYLHAERAEKTMLLKDLIKGYLLIKDFINAFRYMDLYISERYPDHEKYVGLKEDMDTFLKEIKEFIKERNKRDIIINWVDAISYYDIPEFPFLKEKTDEGIFFENAYTVMPWTTETTKTILFGEYPIEGKLFLRGHLSRDDVKLLKILKENGYDFRYCGMPRFAKLFDEKDMAYVHCFENKFCGSMQRQWDALSILCKSEQPLCILIHTLRETHEPFICGECDTLQWFGSTKTDWQQEACRKQAEISGRYIDDQLRFYEGFYGESAVEIYMSDHGRVGNSPMCEDKIHVMLSVYKRGITHKVISQMFSLVHFPELIRMIVQNDENWDDLGNDRVWIENLDAYSELAVRDTLSGRLDQKEMYQCRGIVTAEDRYFLYAYGEEFYFKDRVSEENKINDPLYKDRISELRRACGDTFIDIFKYEKFKFSRQLYKDVSIDSDRSHFI